jgi:hypothetical protein
MATKGYEFQSEFAKKFIAEGEAIGEARGEARGEVKGQAKLLLKMLQIKGFSLTEAQRQRVMSCADEAQFDIWAGRVLTARSVEDVFAE